MMILYSFLLHLFDSVCLFEFLFQGMVIAFSLGMGPIPWVIMSEVNLHGCNYELATRFVYTAYIRGNTTIYAHLVL